MMATWLPKTCWANITREMKNTRCATNPSMDSLPANQTWQPPCSHGTYQHEAITSRSIQLLMMGTCLPETCWATIRREIKNTKKWHLVGFSYPSWITNIIGMSEPRKQENAIVNSFKSQSVFDQPSNNFMIQFGIWISQSLAGEDSCFLDYHAVCIGTYPRFTIVVPLFSETSSLK